MRVRAVRLAVLASVVALGLIIVGASPSLVVAADGALPVGEENDQVDYCRR